MRKISITICIVFLLSVMLFSSNKALSGKQEKKILLTNNKLIENVKQEETINELEIKEYALKVLNSIISLKITELYDYISENRGIYFSNFDTFNFTYDIFLKKEELINEKINQKKVTWWDDAIGENNGTLEEFLTIYFDKEITRLNGILINEICDEMIYMNHNNEGKLYQEYDKGFRHSDIKQIQKSFPDSIIVDCFFCPSGNFGAMDWSSILLVLEKEDDNYILVGVGVDLIGM